MVDWLFITATKDIISYFFAIIDNYQLLLHKNLKLKRLPKSFFITKSDKNLKLCSKRILFQIAR